MTDMSIEALDARAEHNNTILRALRKADAVRSMTEAKLDGSCVVYFVREIGVGAIKIGVTKNLKSRLSMLRVNSPHEMNVLANVPGDERLEQYIHDRFGDSCIRGEWFQETSELLSCIEELKLGPPLLSDSEQLLVDEASKTWVKPFADRPKRTKRRWVEPKNRAVRQLMVEAEEGTVATEEEKAFVRGYVIAVSEFARCETTPKRVLVSAGLTRELAVQADVLESDLEPLNGQFVGDKP